MLGDVISFECRYMWLLKWIFWYKTSFDYFWFLIFSFYFQDTLLPWQKIWNVWKKSSEKGSEVRTFSLWKICAFLQIPNMFGTFWNQSYENSKGLTSSTNNKQSNVRITTPLHHTKNTQNLKQILDFPIKLSVVFVQNVNDFKTYRDSN